MNDQFISIVIPALNEEKTIDRCLSSIYMNAPKDLFEIIVIDNGSADRTREVAERYHVKVLLLPDVSIAALRNYGVRFAKGNIIAFLDADCTVDDGWFRNALNCFRDEEVIAVGSHHRVPDDFSWVARAWSVSKSEKKEITFANYIPSGNCFVRKEYFLEMGGFQENLLTTEDTDLCYRLCQANYKILSVRGIKAVHLGAPQTLREFFQKELWHGKEVFKIFLQSGTKLRNLKVLFYALFYIVITLGIILAILFFQHRLLIFLVVFSLLVPFLISLKTSIEKSNYKYLIGLWVLYLIYGIARAVCVIDYHNWRTTPKDHDGRRK